MDAWRNAYAARRFVIEAIRSDYKARFADSVFGALWMILNPLALVAIYTFVLSIILAAKLPGIEHAYAYPVYLISGLVGWTLFSEVFVRSSNVFGEFASLCKKTTVPVLAYFCVVIGTGFVNAALLWLASLAILFLLGVPISFWVISVPLILGITAFFGAGLGALLSVFQVFAKDIGQALPILLQLLFWLTPIVYTVEMIPADLAWFANYHPFAPLIGLFHNTIAYGEAPHIGALGVYVSVTAAIWWLFWRIYSRAEPELLDAL